MSANASFEESVVALKSMFPDIPELVVRTTLEARDGHVESSVEKLLQMSRRGGGGHTQVGGFDRAPGAIGMSPSSRNGGYGNGGYGDQSMGSQDYYSNVPPPREEDSLWDWLTGPSTAGNSSNDETWNWISNQMSYLALEASRQIKGVTDAIAEEILGPPEEELGEEVEEITEEERERADVVSGGMSTQASRRAPKAKKDTPPPKKKPGNRAQEYEEEDDDALGAVLNLLGLEDEDEEEEYVRRDSKKDK